MQCAAKACKRRLQGCSSVDRAQETQRVRSVRLFFALWPDADIAVQLAGAAAQLTMRGPGRLVKPSNYHLTLAFVGEVPSPQVAMLRKIGRSLRAPRCAVSFDSMEFWPASQIVVGAAREVPSGLSGLSKQLHDAIPIPQTRFRAHVTLARKVAQPPVLQAMSPIVWRATRFSLIRSETGGAESAYTVVDTWPLLDETRSP
jgi:2'-5' RNA ligase